MLFGVFPLLVVGLTLLEMVPRHKGNPNRKPFIQSCSG